MNLRVKPSKALLSLTLIVIGVGATLGTQSLRNDQPNCKSIVRSGRVPSADESRVQLMLRYTFAISAYRWLDPSTQASILEQARITEANHANEAAGLSVNDGDLTIVNFSKLTPKFQQALLESFGQGLRLGKSEATKADRTLVYDYAQEASIIAASNGKCFPEFSFERR
jgi:hypothetical protein